MELSSAEYAAVLLEQFVEILEEPLFVREQKIRAAEVLLRTFLRQADGLKSLQRTQRDRRLAIAVTEGEKLLALLWALHNRGKISIRDSVKMSDNLLIKARILYAYWCAAIVYGIFDDLYDDAVNG